MIRATEWMSGRWWAALVIVLAFVLVARTGTVGAPAEAHARDSARASISIADSAPVRLERERTSLALERHVRYLESEVTLLRAELESERERAGLLASSYDELEAQFDRVTESVRALVEESPVAAPLVPVPVEAIHVIGLEDAEVHTVPR